MAEDYSDSFKVEKLLGRGSFGSVYLVKSLRDKKQYALKVVVAGMLSKDIWKEFNVMAEMDHRNIIKMYKAYQALKPDGSVKSLAIQIQYCPNGDLRTYLAERKGKVLTQKKLATWMADLAAGVDYIHSLNVLHRDLKPENILLTASDILKICDFGIAKVLGECYAATIIGTPLFFAPEVLNGQRYNEKADIFSLGQVFICLATVSGRPTKILSELQTYDVAIYNLIRRCTLENPGRRPNAKIVYKDTQDIVSAS